MNAHEITCPKCGHLNNYISEGCVKCGIIFSKYYQIQARQKEKEIPNAGVTGTETKSQEFLEPVVQVNPEAAGSESPVVEGQVGLKASTGGSESESQLKVEVKSQGISSAPSSEISMQEIEMPETLQDEPAPGKIQSATGNDLRNQSAQAELKASDKKVAPPIRADELPAETEAPIPAEAQGEQASPKDEPAPTEAATPQEVLELIEPAEKEPAGQVELEAKAPEPPEPVKEKEADSDGPWAVSGSDEEKAKAVAPDGDPPAQVEEEIVLEEIAAPAKVSTVAAKGEDRLRAELLKKQRAALARAETLKHEREAQEKAAALKKQKTVPAKLDAVKKQNTVQAKMEALKKQKAEPARAERAEALKKQKVSPVKTEVLKRPKEAPTETEVSVRKTQAVEKEIREVRQPLLKIMGLLKKYEGQTIGINYDNSAEIKAAELIEANDEFFSVRVKDHKLQYSYPLQTLLSLIEGEEGVEMGEAEKKSNFSAVIKVYPLVLF
jgi:hypothetical protein